LRWNRPARLGPCDATMLEVANPAAVRGIHLI
jgi:hypothetical protein